MPTTEFDYLIVGQGLAGTILAHSLITSGCRVMVIDNLNDGSSSKVAAGIINPITGPRLKQDNDFKDFYSHAKSYYAKLEYHIKKTVLTEINQVRQIQTEEQLTYLEKRLTEPDYHKSLEYCDDNTASHFRSNELPIVTINGTAIVNTKELLKASREWLTSLHCYRASKFNYQELKVSANSVCYQNICAEKIIFCEGYQSVNNPWLKHLPFKLAKGEIITLKNSLSNNTMLSWNKWFVPLGETAKLGSNFVWNDLNLKPNEQTKEMLLTSLKENTNLTSDVVMHEVGIRPSTLQREPFVGALSTLEHAYCFNGFGSKGCLLIPFYANLLVKHLRQQSPLPEKVSKWL